MIRKLTCGRFEIRANETHYDYFIDGEQINFADYEQTTPERVTLEVLQELLDRENEDSGLSWETHSNGL
jgi:hypothetical protein